MYTRRGAGAARGGGGRRHHRAGRRPAAAVEEDLFDLFGVASTIIKSAYLEPWERGTVEFRCFAWLFQRLEWLRMQAMDSVFMLFTIVFVAF